MRSRILQFYKGEIVVPPWTGRETIVELAMMEPDPDYLIHSRVIFDPDPPEPGLGGRVAWTLAFATVALLPFGIWFFLGR